MPYETFWHLSPRKLKPFVEAEKIRAERKDYEMWLQGGYFYDGLSAALSNFGAGLSGKHGKGKYPNKPYTEKAKPLSADRERQKAVDYFNDLLLSKSSSDE